MSEPTRFYIVGNDSNRRLEQSQDVQGQWGKKADFELPYGSHFNAKVRLTYSHTNYNGSTYFEWVSGAGVKMYSNVKDYTAIVLALKPDSLGYYEGTFRFVTRGGRNRSLALADLPKLVAEPNIADTVEVAQTVYDKILQKADFYTFKK